MSKDAATTEGDRTYGELLGEYFTLVSEIAPLLDEFGHPENGQYETYVRLREEKDELRAALTDETPDHETTDIETILDEAFAEL